MLLRLPLGGEVLDVVAEHADQAEERGGSDERGQRRARLAAALQRGRSKSGGTNAANPHVIARMELTNYAERCFGAIIDLNYIWKHSKTDSE